MGKFNVQPYDHNHRPGPGRVNLLLAGFFQQSLVSTEQVVDAIEALPISHIEGLQVVRYDPQRTIQQAIAQSSGTQIEYNVMGAFYYSLDMTGIVLYRFHSVEQFYHMLYHEIGHYVFLRVMDQDLRDEWIYRVRPAQKAFVSHYATSSANEDFAESYAFFCVYPQTLWKIPPKMRFIAEKVFYLDPGSYDFSEPEPPPAPNEPTVSPAYPDLE